jgi:hypothetical protein
LFALNAGSAPDNPLLPLSFRSDLFVAELNRSNGTVLSGRQFGTDRWEYPTALLAEGTNLWIGGHTTGSLVGRNQGSSDVFVLRVDMNLPAPNPCLELAVSRVGSGTADLRMSAAVGTVFSLHGSSDLQNWQPAGDFTMTEDPKILPNLPANGSRFFWRAEAR